MGADTSLIDIYGGTVELYNVTLVQSMIGITTYYSAESISMTHLIEFETESDSSEFVVSDSETNWFSVFHLEFVRAPNDDQQ